MAFNALKSAGLASAGIVVLASMAFAGTPEAGGGIGGHRIDNKIDAPTKYHPQSVMVPTLTPSGKVFYGKKNRGTIADAASKGVDNNNSLLSPRSNTPPGATQSNTRASRGVVAAGKSNNARGAFSSDNARLERGPQITRDGQYVVFQSGATNLVPNDTNGQFDIFRLKLSDGSITQVDTYDGTNAQVTAQYAGDYNNSMCPAASSDGRYVAFYTDKKLAADDTDILQDCYIKDMTTGAAKRLSGGITHPERGTNPCGSTQTDFTYYINLWGLDISNDGQHVAFLFPDSTICDSFNAGIVYPNGYLYNWTGSIATGARTIWTERDPGLQPPQYYADTMNDLRISGDGRLIAFWSDDDLGVTGSVSFNMLGLNLDAAGAFTTGAFYALNTSNGNVPHPGGSSLLFPGGATAGPTSVSDNAAGRILGYLSNVTSPSSGRAFFTKNLTTGAAQQLSGVVPVVSPGTDRNQPGNSGIRYQNQNYVSPSGTNIYITTSYDYSATPFPNDLPDQGSFAEGTSFERLAIHEVNVASPSTRHIANYPGTTAPPLLSAQFRPSVDATGTKMLFTAADGGHTKNGQSAFNYDLYVTDLATRANTALLSPATVAGQTNDHSEGSAISADGNWVVYTTGASNVEAGDNNGFTDVVLFDVVGGTSSVISKGPAAVAANAPANQVRADRGFINGSGTDTNVLIQGDPAPTVDKSSISADGGKVAYTSTATNLTADVIPTASGAVTRQVYVYTRSGGTTELVSKNSSGAVADEFNFSPALSGDGNMVAFITRATNLGYTEPSGVQQIVLKDISTAGGLGAVTLVSASSTAAGSGASDNSYSCQIGGSAGSYKVVFDSIAMDLTAITNATNDEGVEVFLYDVASATNSCVSLKSDGAPYKSPSFVSGTGPTWDSVNPSISHNGQYVIFSSDANLVPSDTTPASPNSATAGAPRSLYRYTVASGPSSLVQVNVDSAGVEQSQYVDDGGSNHDLGVSGYAAITNDGNTAFFWTEQPLDPTDTNMNRDLYAKDLTAAGTKGVTRVALENASTQANSLGGKFEFDAGGNFTKPTRMDDPTISDTNAQHIKVAFSSDNPNLVAGDTNGHFDIFIADFLLGGAVVTSTPTPVVTATPTPTPASAVNETNWNLYH